MQGDGYKMHKPYRVLLVIRWPIGGIRTFFRYFYRNFDSERYEFTIVAPTLPETVVLLEDLSSLHVRYIPVEKDVTMHQYIYIVTTIIRSHRYDLIHSHGFICGVCSVMGAVSKRIPHVLTLHETLDQERFNDPAGYIRKVGLSIALSLTDRIHCVSRDARDNLLAYIGLLKFFTKKIVVIPNGIEVERFRNAETRNLRRDLGLPEDSFLIGFLGRYMPEKGFRYLVEAFEYLIKSLGSFEKKPVILSFNEEDAFIREEKENVRNRGLSSQVLFLPFIKNVAPTLRGLDVVVMPSLREACGLLAMETLVTGTPIIGTNCIGLREVLKDTPAKIVPTKGSLALAMALIDEIKNPSKLIAKEFANEAAIRFDVRGRAMELEKLMLELMKSK